jgi:hypothetical protein
LLKNDPGLQSFLEAMNDLERLLIILEIRLGISKTAGAIRRRSVFGQLINVMTILALLPSFA